MSNNIAIASSPTFSDGPNHWASSCRPFRGTQIRLFLRNAQTASMLAFLACRLLSLFGHLLRRLFSRLFWSFRSFRYSLSGFLDRSWRVLGHGLFRPLGNSLYGGLSQFTGCICNDIRYLIGQ